MNLLNCDHKRQMPRWLGFLLIASLSLSLTIMGTIVPTAGQNVTQARVTDILDGNQVYIQERQAQVNAIANRSEKVRTGNARVQLSFNTGAVARLSKNSVLTVGSECAAVQQGNMLVSGSMNGCTKSAIVGVRGTTYVLNVDPSGDEDISVLEGEVEVRSLNDPSEQAPGFQAIRLRAGQAVGIGRGRRLRAIRQLSQLDYDRLVTSELLNDYRDDIPHWSQLQQTYRRLYPNARFPQIRRPPLPNRPRLPNYSR